MHLSDKKLLKLFLKNEAAAERAFVDKYRPWILGVAKKHHRLDAFAAEEIVQTTLLALLESDCKAIRNWRGEGKFSTYLTVIVNRICLRHIKKNQPPKVIDDLKEATAPEASPEHQAEQAQQFRLVKQYFEQLSGRDQLLLTYRFLDEKEPSEIAQIMDMKPATVRKAIHDALNRLRKKLPFDVTHQQLISLIYQLQ